MERLTQVTIADNKEPHQILQGEAAYWKRAECWIIGCPGCAGAGNLAGHDVTYDEQAKLLTVSPSILCGCGTHYFVERNQIRWV